MVSRWSIASAGMLLPGPEKRNDQFRPLSKLFQIAPPSVPAYRTDGWSGGMARGRTRAGDEVLVHVVPSVALTNTPSLASANKSEREGSNISLLKVPV